MKMKIIFKENGYKLIIKYKSGGTMKGLFVSKVFAFDFENLEDINKGLSIVTGFKPSIEKDKMEEFINKSLKHIEI